MNESGGYFCGLCCKQSLGEFGNLIRVRPSFWRKQDFLILIMDEYQATVCRQISHNEVLAKYSPRNRRSRGPMPDAAMFLTRPLREVGDARRVDGDPGSRPAAGVIDDVIDPPVHGQVNGH